MRQRNLICAGTTRGRKLVNPKIEDVTSTMKK
jgi:hypothetical protein